MIDLNALVDRFGELSKGDVAVALVFGTAGAVVDGIWNPLAAFTWQQSGMLSAAGAVGIKRSIESAFASLIERRRNRKLETQQRIRADKLLQVLHDEKPNTRAEIIRRLEESLKLFDLEITQVNELTSAIDETIKTLRDEKQ